MTKERGDGSRNETGRRGAVSEVVGAMVLVAIAMLVMAILALVIFANPLPTRVPSFAGFISNNSRTIYISHEGGDPLLWGQYKILVDNVDETWNFTRSLDANRTFSLGMVMNATLPRMSKRVVVIFNTSWGGGTMLLSADLTKTQVPVPYGWFSPDWSYRKKIVINHLMVQGSNAYFPVLYYKVDPDLTGSKTRADGNDILFTSGNGMTQLSHEIEYFDHNSGTLYAWVKVPSVTSSGDTTIYMYYGNSAAASQQNAADVWSNGYVAVWHLDETSGGSGAIKDSTGYMNGTDLGSPILGDPGRINKAVRFDGNNRVIRIDNSVTGRLDFTGGPFTISEWFTHPSSQNTHTVGKRDDSNDQYQLGLGTNPDVFFRAGGNNAWGDTLSYSTWYYYAAVVDASGSSSLYKNGALDAWDGGTPPSTYPHAACDVSIGARWTTEPSTTVRFIGTIDEVHISNVVRLQDWLTTEYNNQNSPGTFVSVGSQQTPGTMS